MEYFIFNGINSKDLGIVIKSLPSISIAKRRIETISVGGRNGTLHVDDGTYESKNVSLECVCIDVSKVDLLKSTLDPIGEIEFSNEKGRVHNCQITNQIDFAVYLTFLKEFSIELELQPFSKAKEKRIVIEKVEDVNVYPFDIGGTTNTSPIIKVVGIGTFYINNIGVEVKETGITIDCGLMVISKGHLIASDKVDLDEFPFLKPGKNIVSLGTIESLEITFAEAYL